MELGLRPYLGDYYREFAETYPFEFIIGSVHSIQSTDPASGKLFQDKTDEEAYRIAFEETLTDIQRFDGFDVLGHLDYVVRYGKEREKQYSYQNTRI